MATAKRKSPAAARAQIAAARAGGKIVGGRLQALLRKYAAPEAAETFVRYRTDTNTILFIDAFRDLARTPGTVVAGSEALELGVTLGLQLAADLLDDPSQIFDHLFSGPTPGARAVELGDDGGPPDGGPAPAP